ncbi:MULTISPECIES: RagB/SusD family nutrient uptake outer membrane protein [Sphingobacterium]|uniref:RagB/SusD family nutrient uptake outer membrane protein n=1 Tax=Sphingobacterium TaxID=28453 RepID=UPI001051C406|nr:MULTISPECIES: RagB/SusD family nutrient uptake outer membrane protein [Sphingobacterium]MCW2263050.1 tetratricopeptide (TPR) repeat protein [Sphingobacterium kitahiroshimense]TCR11960.1 putative outer membrane starch-binding protein [Sphingobacterium sp. JUb78]
MKKLYKYIFWSILFLSVTSCSNSLLDKEPISNFSGEGYYKKPSDAQAGVNGIYNGLQTLFRQNYAHWGEGRADNVVTRHAGDPGALQQNTLTPIINSARWDNFYTVISRANYAIKYIPQAFGDEDSELKKQLLGQAHALRALAYFYLVRIWGEVPLVIEPYEGLGQDLFVKKNTEAEVLAKVEEDLMLATENCATNYSGAGNRVLITKGAAYAFLTQLYMWQKKYAQAIEMSEKVLADPQYTLVSIEDWNNIFVKGSSAESIFEVGYNEVQTNNLRIWYAMGSDSDYVPSTSFIASIEPGDLRKPRIYDVSQVQPRKIWKFFGQGFNDESPEPSAGNMVLTRVADILLLKAEAHANLNQPVESLDLLNRIRIRAGLVALDQNKANIQFGNLLTGILHERSIELSFEGHRWFDLVRTGTAISTMKPINGLSDNRNLLWPIHEGELLKNPNLKQNEFYR